MSEEEKKITGVEYKTYWTTKMLDQLGLDLLEWYGKKGNFLMDEFFTSRHIPMEHVDYFLDNPKGIHSKIFEDCYNLAKDIQKVKIIQMLTDKSFATSGMILLAKNILGWDAMTEQEQTININAGAIEDIKKKYFKKSKKMVSPDGELVNG